MPNKNNRKSYNNNSKTIPQGISFKAITSFNKEEMAFLCELYATTRWDEVLQAPWTDEQRYKFLQQQFDAQHKHYQSHYPHSDFLLIKENDKNIGRLYIDRDDNSICLIDIAFLPQYRNNGLGTVLLEQLLNEAQKTNKKIVLHVEKFNPAYQWYIKHGFEQIEDKGVHQYMEWYPK